MRYTHLLTIALIFLLPTTLVLANTASLQQRDYDELNRLLYTLKHQTRSGYIDTEFTLVRHDDNIQQKDVRLWLTRGNQTIAEAEIDSEGNISLPVLSPAQAKGVTLHFNQPKRAVGIRLSAGMKQLETRRVNYRDLFVVLDDINDFSGEVGGLAAWLLPDMDALGFDFDSPASIDILSAGGTLQFKSNNKHRIVIDYNEQLMKENPTMVFSQRPTWTWPED